MGLENASDSRVLLPALGTQPGHLLWRAAARVTVNLAEVLPSGVDIHQYAVLLSLADGRARSQQSIADTIDVSRTTMVKLAAVLSEMGFVERVRNPEDRRSYLLTRTPAGEAATGAWRAHAQAVEDALTPGFTAGDREELRTLLLGILEGELAPDVPEPLVHSLGFLITRAHVRMHRAFAQALAPLRIVPPHFGLMTTLATLGPVPQSEVGRRLGISAPSVVQMVDDLEALGLVERRRAETDRRTQLLHLRPEATPVLQRAGQVAAETLADRLGSLTPARTDRLVALLQRFVTGG